MVCPLPCHLSPTGSKAASQHVLGLALASLMLPNSTPSHQAPPPARNRRCTAGRHSVEQLQCTASSAPLPPDQHATEPPDRSYAHPSVPGTPQTRPRASPAQHDAASHTPVPAAAWHGPQGSTSQCQPGGCQSQTSPSGLIKRGIGKAGTEEKQRVEERRRRVEDGGAWRRDRAKRTRYDDYLRNKTPDFP